MRLASARDTTAAHPESRSLREMRRSLQRRWLKSHAAWLGGVGGEPVWTEQGGTDCEQPVVSTGCLGGCRGRARSRGQSSARCRPARLWGSQSTEPCTCAFQTLPNREPAFKPDLLWTDHREDSCVSEDSPAPGAWPWAVTPPLWAVRWGCWYIVCPALQRTLECSPEGLQRACGGGCSFSGSQQVSVTEVAKTLRDSAERQVAAGRKGPVTLNLHSSGVGRGSLPSPG